MKKLFALLLALCMIAALTAVCFAEDTYNIVIKNALPGHTYEAYQIFEGTLYENLDDNGEYVNTTLADIVFGSGITAAGQSALLAELGTDKTVEDLAETLTDEAAAGAFAQKVEPYLTAPSATTSAFNEATNSYTLTVSEPGYYLMRDKAATQLDQDDVHTLFVLRVTRLNDNTVINLKQDREPDPEKKVSLPVEGATDLSEYNFVDSLSTNIGDTLTYDIVSRFDDNRVEDGEIINFQNYKKYFVRFTDTLSAGLKLVDGTVRAFANEDMSDLFAEGVDYTVTVTENADGTTDLEVYFEDLVGIDYKDSDTKALTSICVLYDVVVDTDAVVGVEGNANTFSLEFSNDPNDESGETYGSSEEVEPKVYTYSLRVNKVDENDLGLGGAKFIFYKLDDAGAPCYLFVTREGANTFVSNKSDATVFTSAAQTGLIEVAGLAEGTYFAEEVQAPFGYSKLSDAVEITIDATVNYGVGMAKITNYAGFNLPGTGGMGTTLFTVCGLVLLLGCGVALAVRRRTTD